MMGEIVQFISILLGICGLFGIVKGINKSNKILEEMMCEKIYHALIDSNANSIVNWHCFMDLLIKKGLLEKEDTLLMGDHLSKIKKDPEEYINFIAVSENGLKDSPLFKSLGLKGRSFK